MGNLRSVAKALESLGATVQIVDSPHGFRDADRIVFPGVGAYAECIDRLEERGFPDAIRREVREDGKPLLGICLGMQGLVESGDEGGRRNGLGLIPGHIEKFDRERIGGLKIPHIGWNQLTQTEGHPLLCGIEPDSCFYFVHSYFVRSANHTIATCDYGGEFAAAIAHANVFGIQCHPEKSQKPGLRLLANFLAWTP